MNWTPESPPTTGISHYDHTLLETPLGTVIIEWKSWKDNPSYDAQFKDSNVWIGVMYTLDEAKFMVRQYLMNKYNELGEFLNN